MLLVLVSPCLLFVTFNFVAGLVTLSFNATEYIQYSFRKSRRNIGKNLKIEIKFWIYLFRIHVCKQICKLTSKVCLKKYKYCYKKLLQYMAKTT